MSVSGRVGGNPHLPPLASELVRGAISLSLGVFLHSPPTVSMVNIDPILEDHPRTYTWLITVVSTVSPLLLRLSDPVQMD